MSTDGGSVPRWRRDCQEIFYVAPNTMMMMAAAVNGQGASFAVESIKALFPARPALGDWPFDVSPDGQRFLVISPTEDTTSDGITVSVNWTPPVPEKH